MYNALNILDFFYFQSNVTQTTSLDSCSGSAFISGLHPYTVYEVRVECQASDYGEMTGWSEPATLTFKTKEGGRIVKHLYIDITKTCPCNIQRIFEL